MLFFSGRAAQGAAVLRLAKERLPPDTQARERLEVALLGLSSTSASARREAHATFAELRDPGGPAHDVLQATTLATLAMEQVLFVGSAATTIDLAKRAIAAGLPLEPHRGENWVNLALAALGVADALDDALRGADEILTHARAHGAAMTVMTISSLRALMALRRGDLAGAQEDAQTAIALAPDLFGARFLVLAVSAAVLAGLERDETPEALRGLIDRTGVGFDPDFTSSSQLRYASGVLRAAGGNHEAAIEELEACGREEPAFGGENPAMIPWRSAAALSLAELGRHEDARELAADEVRRAQSFGATRAIGVALRAQARVGPRAGLLKGLSEARAVLEASPARLERARVLVDLGASLRAAGPRTAARDPLLEALALAARCGARALERRARAELSAIGVRPRSTNRSGADSLTPSERRVVDLAAGGGTNREIAQTLFVTEKTVETHLGRAFRKLDVSSRRQLPEVLARAESAPV
jgi:DNA-binding CsgD family transcriptional regulator